MPGMRMVVRNLESVPVTIDRAGHQLGAGEFGVVNDGDHTSAAALAAGNIGAVERPDPSVDVDPAAAAAFELLDAKDAGDSAAVTEARADLSAGNDGQPVDLTDVSDAGAAAETSSAKTTTGRAKGNR